MFELLIWLILLASVPAGYLLFRLTAEEIIPFSQKLDKLKLFLPLKIILVVCYVSLVVLSIFQQSQNIFSLAYVFGLLLGTFFFAKLK